MTKKISSLTNVDEGHHEIEKFNEISENKDEKKNILIICYDEKFSNSDTLDIINKLSKNYNLNILIDHIKFNSAMINDYFGNKSNKISCVIFENFNDSNAEELIKLVRFATAYYKEDALCFVLIVGLLCVNNLFRNINCVYFNIKL